MGYIPHTMRFILMIVIALALGLGVYYVMLSDNGSAQTNTREAANDAKSAADAYKKSQEDMMRQLGQ